MPSADTSPRATTHLTAGAMLATRRRLRRWLVPLLLLAGTSLASAADQPRRGGTLNWIVTPEPALFVPLTTTAGGSTELGPKVVEGLLN